MKTYKQLIEKINPVNAPFGTDAGHSNNKFLRNNDDYETYFMIDEQRVCVMFEYAENKMWHVEFNVLHTSYDYNTGPHGISVKSKIRNVQQMFGIVIAIVIKFIKYKKPSLLIFQGSSDKHDAIYTRILSRQDNIKHIKSLGYSVETYTDANSYKTFYIKRNVDEDI
jgi:hypothetical protein